jgi:hypothetical protein
MDEPDYDDLIADAMEAYDDEPPEEDWEEQMKMMGPADPPGATSLPQPTTVVRPAVTPVATEHDDDDDDAASASPWEASLSSPLKRKDAFSFERYVYY